MTEELGTEEIGTSERILGEWPTKIWVDATRKVFIRIQKKSYLTFFQENEHFSDLPSEQKDLGAELLARFFFGVDMDYKRFGSKYPIYDIGLDAGEEADYEGIAFWEDENKYLVRISWLKKVLEHNESEGKYFFNKGGGGIKQKVPAGDMFEIAGVEEAAHLMLFNEKGDMGKKELDEAGEKFWYQTSDAESRALKWKLAYVKRYMPQYYDSLRQTAEKVEEIRLDSAKDQEG